MTLSSLFALSGKTALVTGCDRGLEQAMAMGMAEAGADILGGSNNDTIVGGETEAGVRALGRSFTLYVADLSNRDVIYSTEALRADADRSKAILDRIPAGRWGQADDFRRPVVFLCSEAGCYVNGTILTVDGGWMAW